MPIPDRDPFFDEHDRPRKLFGVGLPSASCRLAELAGRIGYQTTWIDVEHGGARGAEIESLCRASEVGGAVPAVRISSACREHVLQALEAGARLVIVPMVNLAEEARQIVDFGKFPPMGRRGFNSTSRGVSFGLAGILDEFASANKRTHLIAQIETIAAAAEVEAICQVAGLSGILVGPGDLSQDMGKSAQFRDPDLIHIVVGCIEKACSLGKHAGIFTSSPFLLEAAMAAGCDFAFVSSDIGDLTQVWTTRYRELAERYLETT
jgi:2-keto-3-deoxy-L-rhamnonate aldolase RhmA